MRFYWGGHNHTTVRGHSAHTHTDVKYKVPAVNSWAENCEQVHAISIHVPYHTTGSNGHITPGKWDSAKTVTGGSISIQESLARAFSFTQLTAHLHGRLFSKQSSQRTRAGPVRIQLLSDTEKNRRKCGFFLVKNLLFTKISLKSSTFHWHFFLN